MSKYTSKFKLEVVEYCLRNNYGYGETARYFNIPSQTAVLEWVRKFEEHGIAGLVRSSIKYDGNFKKQVIEYMHSNHLSLTETAIKFNIANHVVVGKWERIYYEEGAQALFEERRGRSRNMDSKPKKKKLSKQVEEDLIEENQRLRMENAYLKKLNALVQERVTRENKKK